MPILLIFFTTDRAVLLLTGGCFGLCYALQIVLLLGILYLSKPCVSEVRSLFYHIWVSGIIYVLLYLHICYMSCAGREPSVPLILSSKRGQNILFWVFLFSWVTFKACSCKKFLRLVLINTREQKSRRECRSHKVEYLCLAQSHARNQ